MMAARADAPPLTGHEVREVAIATLRDMLSDVPADATRAVSDFETRLLTWRRETPHIVVAPHVRWIRAPSGTTIHLARRPACRKIVAALVEHHSRAPGEALSREELILRTVPSDVANRRQAFRVAMKRLRLAGFEEILVRLGSGYLLNPTIPVVRARALRAHRDASRSRAGEVVKEDPPVARAWFVDSQPHAQGAIWVR
jgi:hypothetical protein